MRGASKISREGFQSVQDLLGKEGPDFLGEEGSGQVWSLLSSSVSPSVKWRGNCHLNGY